MCCVIAFTLTKPEICSGSNSKPAIWKEPTAFLGSGKDFEKQKLVCFLQKKKKENVKVVKLLGIGGVYLYELSTGTDYLN